MSGGELLYLSRRDVESLGLGFPEITQALESAFREKAAGRVVMPAKHWIERSPDTFYSAMTSYMPALRAAGCKWQSGDPRNTERGLAYILGLYILNDDETGLPIAIMDSTWLTAMRTAAASALTARYLSPDRPRAVGVLGCGVQGRANLEALVAALPSIDACCAFDIKPQVAERYAEDLSRKLGIRVSPVTVPRDAVREADIVVTAGPITHVLPPTIEAGWLHPGALGIALDYDSYWTPDAIRSMDHVVADDVAQLEHLKESGFFRAVGTVDADLAEVVTGQKLAHRPPSARVLAFNLGVAIEDLATALELYRRGREKGLGTFLPL